MPISHGQLNGVGGGGTSSSVISLPNYASRPLVGQKNVIYYTEDNGDMYYWDGLNYQLLLGEAFNEKAPLDSPVFIGTPTAPTVATTDSSDELATTNFVHNAINAIPDATTLIKGLTLLQDAISDTTSTTKAVTPNYVTSAINYALLNPNELASADWGTVTNILLTGVVTYQGQVIPNAKRVVVTGQTDTKTNGVYLSNNLGSWTRTTDADTITKLYLAQIVALNGTKGKYLCSVAKDAVLGTSPIPFVQLYQTNNEVIGVQSYQSSTIYNANDLATNPSVDNYIYRCLTNGTVNIAPSMTVTNWEIYQGLLYQNSVIVAPNGNDDKSIGFPYLTYTGAIVDMTTNSYIEGRSLVNTETIIPKDGMKIAGKKAQVNNIILSANNVILDGMTLINTIGSAPALEVTTANGSEIINCNISNGASATSILFSGAWSGTHTIRDSQITGMVSISGSTASGIIRFIDISSAVALSVNCLNSTIYISNCPNFSITTLAGTVYRDVDTIKIPTLVTNTTAIVATDSLQTIANKTQGQLNALKNIFPVGTMLDNAFAVDHDGWFVCDGRALTVDNTTKITAAGLLTAWTNAFGNNLPDYRGKVGGYVGSTHALGSSVGSETVTLTTNELPAHNHTFTGTALGTHTHSFTGTALSNVTPTFTGTALGTHTHTFTGTALGTHNHVITDPGHTHGLSPYGFWYYSGVSTQGRISQTTSANQFAADASGGIVSATTGITNTAISAGTPAGTNTAISAGTPAGTISTITGQTPAGTNTAISAGTPAGTISSTGTGAAFSIMQPTLFGAIRLIYIG